VAARTGKHAVQWVRTRNPWSDAEPWRRTHPWRMYALGLGERWLQPEKRFVIVTPGRTGSELLVDMLNSHPDIVCDPEILDQRRVLPERFVAGRATRAGLAGAQAYGFKLFCGHFGYQPMRDRDQFLRQLSDDGVRLIFLRRQNRLAQAVSSVVAGQTRWHWRQADGAIFTPMTLDAVEVLVMLYLFEESEQYLESILAPLPHMRLVYEDDLIDPPVQQATVDRICAELGLPSAPARSDLVRVTPPRLEDAIANYREVADLVRPTRFGCYLDEPKLVEPERVAEG
jgi:LPS sulfotransferase NodH